MKCVQYYPPKSKIERVSDEAARDAVASGDAFYVPKRTWKDKVRDAVQEAA